MSDPLSGLNSSQFATYVSNQNTTKFDSPEVKREKVLNALEQSFPFFEATESKSKKVEVDKGTADKPPVHKGKSVAEGVRDFFKGLGKLIAAPFKMIHEAVQEAKQKAAEKKELKAETKEHEAYIQTQTFKDGRISNENAVEFLGRAAKVHNVDLAVKVLEGTIQFLTQPDTKNRSIALDKFDGASVQEKVVASLKDLSGSLGFAFTPELVENLRGMRAGIAEKLGADHPGLFIVDKFLNDYDFNALMQTSFNEEISKLGSIDTKTTVQERKEQIHTVIESAFRQNSFFTSGMKAMAVQHFDAKDYGAQLLNLIENEGELNPEFANATSGDLKLDTISETMGRSLMVATESILDKLLDEDGIREALGEAHLTRIREGAETIAALPNVSSDVKNEMIQKLFLDQVFLRNLNASLIQVAQSEGKTTSMVTTTSQLVQVLLNDANPTRPPNDNVAEYFGILRDSTREKIAGLMEAFGIPHVDPQPTDWVAPNPN